MILINKASWQSRIQRVKRARIRFYCDLRRTALAVQLLKVQASYQELAKNQLASYEKALLEFGGLVKSVPAVK